MIYTVFPHGNTEMPQDFETYSEAEWYGNNEFGTGNYDIASNDGQCE